MIKKLFGVNAKGEVVSFIVGGDDLAFYNGYEEDGIVYRCAPIEVGLGDDISNYRWDGEKIIKVIGDGN